MCWKPGGTIQDKIDKLNGSVLSNDPLDYLSIAPVTKNILDTRYDTSISTTSDGYCPYGAFTTADVVSTTSNFTIDFDSMKTIQIICEGRTYTLDKNQLIYFILQLFEEKK